MCIIIITIWKCMVIFFSFTSILLLTSTIDGVLTLSLSMIIQSHEQHIGAHIQVWFYLWNHSWFMKIVYCKHGCEWEFPWDPVIWKIRVLWHNWRDFYTFGDTFLYFKVYLTLEFDKQISTHLEEHWTPLEEVIMMCNVALN
jgi:hypothetical protein